jgi:guanylate kinase
MRPGEVEGKDYFFVSKEQFEEWIAGEQLLEHALVYGEYKGIPRGQVDAALQRGADVVLRIDVQVRKQRQRLLLWVCCCLAGGSVRAVCWRTRDHWCVCRG